MLKPTLPTIILTLVLFVVAVPFLEYDTGTRCNCPINSDCDCLETKTGSLVVYLTDTPRQSILAVKYEYLIAGLILSYLVLSLVVFGLGKLVRKPAPPNNN